MNSQSAMIYAGEDTPGMTYEERQGLFGNDIDDNDAILRDIEDSNPNNHEISTQHIDFLNSLVFPKNGVEDEEGEEDEYFNELKNMSSADQFAEFTDLAGMDDIETSGLSHWVRGKMRNAESIKTPKAIRDDMAKDMQMLLGEVVTFNNLYKDRGSEKNDETSDFNGTKGEQSLVTIKSHLSGLKNNIQDLRIVMETSVYNHKQRIDKFKSDQKKISELKSLGVRIANPANNDLDDDNVETSGFLHWMRGRNRDVRKIKSPNDIKNDMKKVMKNMLEEVDNFKAMYDKRDNEKNDEVSDFNGTKGGESLKTIKKYLEVLTEDVQDLRVIRDSSVSEHKSRLKKYKESQVKINKLKQSGAIRSVNNSDDDYSGTEMQNLSISLKSHIEDMHCMVETQSHIHDEHHKTHSLLLRKISELENRLKVLERK